MKTATGWRAAICLAIALLVCCAGPLRRAPAAPARLQQAPIAQACTSPSSAGCNRIDGRPATQAEVVVAFELSEANRAAEEDVQRPPGAVASNEQAAAAASNDHWVWDEASLIGKILIGIGTLLALTSAARMLMT